MKKLLILVLSILSSLHAAELPVIAKQHWSFQGLLGTFDRKQLQRGFQVYKEVCSACHGLKLVSYRNLKDLGYKPEEIKAIAAAQTIKDGPNDDGEMFERPRRPSDKMLSSYPNDNAARAANNGALPPDLSLLAKSRVGGANYLYALLTGYVAAPNDIKLAENMHYNKAFAGHQIAMANPLSDDQVSYADGTKATVSQMSQDVVTFLTWAADPHQEARKALGFKVLLYLIGLSVVFYLLMQRIWARVKTE